MRYLHLLYLTVMLISVSAQAKDLIVAFPVPLMVENPHQGLAIQLTREIEARANEHFEIHVKPAKRAYQEFKNKNYIALLLAVDYLVKPNSYRSHRIVVKEDFAFVRTNQHIPKSLKQLEDLKIGLTRGYPYHPSLLDQNRFRLSFANDDISNLKMLQTKRIDVFVLEEVTGLHAIKHNMITNVHYDPRYPIFKTDVYVAFEKSKRGLYLKNIFNQQIESMRRDGSFQAIMKPFYDRKRALMEELEQKITIFHIQTESVNSEDMN